MKEWNEKKVIDLVLEARRKGKLAALKKLDELCDASGKPALYLHDRWGVCASMLGMCGYGWVKIDTQQPFYRAASKLSKEKGNEYRFSCKNNTGVKGGIFSIYDMSPRQELEVNKAAEVAVEKYLNEQGIKTMGIHTWID